MRILILLLFSLSAFSDVSTFKYKMLKQNYDESLESNRKLTEKQNSLTSKLKNITSERAHFQESYINLCNDLSQKINNSQTEAINTYNSLTRRAKALKHLNEKENTKDIILTYVIFNGQIEKGKVLISKLNSDLDSYQELCKTANSELINQIKSFTKEISKKIKSYDEALSNHLTK